MTHTEKAAPGVVGPNIKPWNDDYTYSEWDKDGIEYRVVRQMRGASANVVSSARQNPKGADE